MFDCKKVTITKLACNNIRYVSVMALRAENEWTSLCFDSQGLHYYHYELEKNSDPSKEASEEFRRALTVHPVSDPEQMYRLHRFFTELELQRTYEEIAKLQVSCFQSLASHKSSLTKSHAILASAVLLW